MRHLYVDTEGVDVVFLLYECAIRLRRVRFLTFVNRAVILNL